MLLLNVRHPQAAYRSSWYSIWVSQLGTQGEQGGNLATQIGLLRPTMLLYRFMRAGNDPHHLVDVVAVVE
jgi:hypothetical protein